MVAVVAAANIAGNLGGGALLRRGLPRFVILAAVAALYGALAPLILADGIAAGWRLAAAFVFSAVGGMLPAAALSGVPRHAAGPGLIAATNGLVVQVSNTGSLLGPPLLAAAVSWGGSWAAGRWVLAAAASGGLVLALVLRRIEARMPV
jgi:hypothetical protein